MISKPGSEVLMAYADGVLPAAARSRVEQALRVYPELGEEIRLYEESRRVLQAGFAEALLEPVPSRFEDLVMKTALPGLDLDQARTRRRAGFPPGWLNAVAACLVVAAATVAGYAGGRSAAPAGTFTLAGVVKPDGWLGDSLTNVASGEIRSQGDVTFKAIATYLGDEGQVCREIEVVQNGQVSGAVACRNDAVWEVRMAALLGPEVSASEFRPASAGAADVLSIVLDEVSAGDALDTRVEQCLIAQDWTPSADCLAGR